MAIRLSRALRAPARQLYDYFLVLDFEATCEDNKKIQPFQEIIEFPVAKLNAETLEVESIFHKYVRPSARPVLTDFCTRLTGIIQETVDTAPSIGEVLSSFEDWRMRELQGKKFVFVTCGDWDLKTMLPGEAQNKNIHLPQYFADWINVKKSFCELKGMFLQGMPALLKHMEIKHTGRLHSGIDDVGNIVEITKWLTREGHILKPHSQQTTSRVFGARFQ